MSNINSPNAWHGLDDEPHEIERNGKLVQFNGCSVCYSLAKARFFARKYHRRGETLHKLYLEIHGENH